MIDHGFMRGSQPPRATRVSRLAARQLSLATQGKRTTGPIPLLEQRSGLQKAVEPLGPHPDLCLSSGSKASTTPGLDAGALVPDH